MEGGGKRVYRITKTSSAVVSLICNFHNFKPRGSGLPSVRGDSMVTWTRRGLETMSKMCLCILI